MQQYDSNHHLLIFHLTLLRFTFFPDPRTDLPDPYCDVVLRHSLKFFYLDFSYSQLSLPYLYLKTFFSLCAGRSTFYPRTTTMSSFHPMQQTALTRNFTSFPESTPIPLLPFPSSPGLAGTANDTTPLRWFVVELLHGEDSEGNLNRWSSFIGIIIAISGNVLISLALNVQKYAHTRLEREAEGRRARRSKLRIAGRHDANSPDVEDAEDVGENAPLLGGGGSNGTLRNVKAGVDLDEETPASYVSSPYWILGLVMMFFGECGNFLAYAFCAASIVSPLGVVALISNCIIAPVLLKEPFRARDVMGVLVSVAGAVVIVWSAEKEETKLGPDEILDAISQTAFEVYFGVTCALILVLMRLSSKYGHKTVMIDLGLVALFGGYTVLSTKGISSLISSSFYHIFQYPIAYLFTFVLASTAVLQVKYVNRALKRFDSTEVIPTQFVLFTISVIVGSAILYRDFETVSNRKMTLFAIGCTLTFTGVYLISSRRKRGSSRSSSFMDSPEGEDGDVAMPIPILPSSSSRPGTSVSPSPAHSTRPSFYRTGSAVSSNEISTTPTLSASPSEAVGYGLQIAAADPLLPGVHRRRPSESEQMQRALGLMPGSNLMTGYQLQTVIAERTLARQRSYEAAEGSPRARRSSLSVVLDFVKGKRKTDTDVAEVEAEDYDGGEGRA